MRSRARSFRCAGLALALSLPFAGLADARRVNIADHGIRRADHPTREALAAPTSSPLPVSRGPRLARSARMPERHRGPSAAASLIAKRAANPVSAVARRDRCSLQAKVWSLINASLPPDWLDSMDEPVVASDGLAYEKEEVEETWPRAPAVNIALKKVLSAFDDFVDRCETWPANVSPKNSCGPEAEQVWEAIKDSLICPISHEIMSDPVVTADGHTYEREEIEKHFERSGNQKSPLTGLDLVDVDLRPNVYLKHFSERCQEHYRTCSTRHQQVERVGKFGWVAAATHLFLNGRLAVSEGTVGMVVIPSEDKSLVVNFDKRLDGHIDDIAVEAASVRVLLPGGFGPYDAVVVVGRAGEDDASAFSGKEGVVLREWCRGRDDVCVEFSVYTNCECIPSHLLRHVMPAGFRKFDLVKATRLINYNDSNGTAARIPAGAEGVVLRGDGHERVGVHFGVGAVGLLFAPVNGPAPVFLAVPPTAIRRKTPGGFRVNDAVVVLSQNEKVPFGTECTVSKIRRSGVQIRVIDAKGHLVHVAVRPMGLKWRIPGGFRKYDTVQVTSRIRTSSEMAAGTLGVVVGPGLGDSVLVQFDRVRGPRYLQVPPFSIQRVLPGGYRRFDSVVLLANIVEGDFDSVHVRKGTVGQVSGFVEPAELEVVFTATNGLISLLTVPPEMLDWAIPGGYRACDSVVATEDIPDDAGMHVVDRGTRGIVVRKVDVERLGVRFHNISEMVVALPTQVRRWRRFNPGDVVFVSSIFESLTGDVVHRGTRGVVVDESDAHVSQRVLRRMREEQVRVEIPTLGVGGDDTRKVRLPPDLLLSEDARHCLEWQDGEE